MSDELRQRHVVVTGGSGALGGSVVDALLDAGAIVHVPCLEDRVPARLQDRSSERLVATAGVDVAQEDAIVGYFAGVPELWASVHIAGGFAMAPIAETTRADFTAQFELNAVTAFLCCREAVKAMRRGGGGRIVNVAARPAVAPVGGMIAYSVAKSAVAALTRALAEEVRAEGILVNAVLPSIIDTPANRVAMPGADHDAWPKPDELARAIRFLVSPDNSLTTGALLPLFGRA